MISVRRSFRMVSALSLARLGTTLVLVASLTACSSLTVTTDYEADTRFDGYATWALMPPEPPISVAPSDLAQADGAAAADPPLAQAGSLLAQRLERAVSDAMQARGMQLASSAGEADLLVRFHVNIERQLSIQTSSYGPARGPYAYGSRSGRGVAGNDHATIREYERGTLVIDLFDRATGELVWRGWAQSRIRRDGTPESRERRVREAVDAILAEYPPPT